MNRVYPWILLVLAGTTAGSLVFALQQYRRAESLALRQPAGLEVVEVSRPTPEAANPAPGEIAPAAPAEVAGDAVTAATSDVRAGRAAPLRFNELLEDPAFAAAWQAQQKSFIDYPYADLFRRLKLNPAQIEQFKTLLVERTAAGMDVMNAARDQGMSGRENRAELARLMQQTQQEINDGIRDLLGEAKYNEFQRYEQTAPQRGLVDQLETRLSYSSAPLTDAQAETLVNILSDAASPGGNPRVRGTMYSPMGPMPFANQMMGGPEITDAALARAQGVLSSAQLEALRQLQADQQAQRRFNELMRERTQRNRPPPPGPAGG